MSGTPELERYAVRLKCPGVPVRFRDPGGALELEVPTTLGAEAAERRAKMTAVAKGWGDLDEVEILGSRKLAPEEWSD